MNLQLRKLTRLGISLFVAALLGACASHSAPTTSLAAACQSAEQRAFDFWLGHWDVAARGRPPGAVNRISLQAGGCVLRESYSTRSGYTGMSMNWYEPSSREWRQTWIDNTGLVLQLHGGLNAAGQMVLASRGRVDGEGNTVFDRITWTAVAPDEVTQVWATSPTDAGPWEVIFDGVYTRRSADTGMRKTR